MCQVYHKPKFSCPRSGNTCIISTDSSPTPARTAPPSRRVAQLRGACHSQLAAGYRHRGPASGVPGKRDHRRRSSLPTSARAQAPGEPPGHGLTRQPVCRYPLSRLWHMPENIDSGAANAGNLPARDGCCRMTPAHLCSSLGCSTALYDAVSCFLHLPAGSFIASCHMTTAHDFGDRLWTDASGHVTLGTGSK
jgi:hypothetical protein